MMSPWRVLLISQRAGRFLETNMTTDLAPPNRIKRSELAKTGQNYFPLVEWKCYGRYTECAG